MEPQLPQLGKVVLRGQAAIHHHGGAARDGQALVGRGAQQRGGHGGQRRAVGGVAGEGAVQHLEAELVEHHADHHLGAVVAFLLVAPAHRHGVLRATPLEVEVGQVVEEYRAHQSEVRADPFAQPRLDRRALRQQAVARTVITLRAAGGHVAAEKVGKAALRQPVVERVFAQRLREPPQDQRARRLALGSVQPHLAQQPVHPQLLPRVQAGQQRPQGSRVRVVDPIQHHPVQGRSRARAPVASLALHIVHDAVHPSQTLRRQVWREKQLPPLQTAGDQRREPIEPLLGDLGVPERGNHPMPRAAPAGGTVRLEQLEAATGLALLAMEVHAPTIVQLCHMSFMQKAFIVTTSRFAGPSEHKPKIGLCSDFLRPRTEVLNSG